MGLISWLFPSEDDRIAKARKFLADEQWADARLEVLDIQRGEAREIIEQAEHELAAVNLEHALSWARAGDEYRVGVHLELAEDFHNGGLEEQFRSVRRTIRDIRAQRTAEEKRKREERDARLLAVDPLGLTGQRSLLEPPIDGDLAAEDAQELAARLDLLLENYPEELRSTASELGPEFARAVLDLDDGRADKALQTLLALPDDHPLVCWETTRAAHALGDPKAAARTLRRFSDLAGGHHRIGQMHTGVFLAKLLADSGNPSEALAVLRELRRDEPEVGGFLFAQLLASAGELSDAEKVVRSMIQKNGKYLPLYALLARIRLMGGYRVEAMQALESAMSLTCGSPGQCGYMPPDPGIVRQLAILYLEEGIEQKRALELVDQARGLAKQRGWEDAYMEALAANAQGRIEADDLIEQVWSGIGDEDPRRDRIQKYLPAPA